MFAKKLTCPHCGVRNAVSRKPQAFPRCGRCSRPLVVPPSTVPPARSKTALRGPWLFFWAITLGLVGGAVWHESDTPRAVSPMATTQANADSAIMGRASVIDGDTIEIHGQRIRFWGVDAPEGQQRCTRDGQSWRCGTDAANALDRHISARTVTCTERESCRYGRMVTGCDVAGDDIGAWHGTPWVGRWTTAAPVTYLCQSPETGPLGAAGHTAGPNRDVMSVSAWSRRQGANGYERTE
jgi:endonuclease YncB( thermonuclease family)